MNGKRIILGRNSFMVGKHDSCCPDYFSFAMKGTPVAMTGVAMHPDTWSFMLNTKTGDVIIGKEGESHSELYGEVRKNPELMARLEPGGRNHETWDLRWTVDGRIFVTNPELMSKYDMTDVFLAEDVMRVDFRKGGIERWKKVLPLRDIIVVSLWNDSCTDDERIRMADAAVMAFCEENGHRFPDSYFITGLGYDGNTDECSGFAFLVKAEKADRTMNVRVSGRGGEEMDRLRAIHLARQEDKRNYFAKFRNDRDSRNQEIYNHTPSRTEAEYRWMNTIGDSYSRPYRRTRSLNESKGAYNPDRMCTGDPATPDEFKLFCDSTFFTFSGEFWEDHAIPFIYDLDRDELHFGNAGGTHREIAARFIDVPENCGTEEKRKAEYKYMRENVSGRLWIGQPELDKTEWMHKRLEFRLASGLKGEELNDATRKWESENGENSYPKSFWGRTFDGKKPIIATMWNDLPKKGRIAIFRKAVKEYSKCLNPKSVCVDRFIMFRSKVTNLKTVNKFGRYDSKDYDKDQIDIVKTNGMERVTKNDLKVGKEQKGLDAARAIHLANQEDKRNYFRKFRDERDSRNQEIYNHTPSRTEAEWRSLNTIGDSLNVQYRKKARMNE